MDEHRTEADMNDDRTATEMTAGLLLVALDAVIAGNAMTTTEPSQQRDAERYTMRLRFALARVEELRTRADTLGGVFEPARLEVARAILETHCERATYFVTQALGRPVKDPRRAAIQRVLPAEAEATETAPKAQAA